MAVQPRTSVWEGLSQNQRKFIVVSLTVAIVQFVLVDVYFRLQQLSAINGYLSGTTGEIPGDGITYLPLFLSLLVYGAAAAAPVALANFRAKPGLNPALLLGSAWILASVALSFDYLVDSFEPKLAIAALFLFVGVRYWRGSADNSMAFILGPLVTIVAAGDGFAHISGLFCSASGLDSCSAKAISDSYLVMMLLPLTYFTVAYRERRPSPMLILAAVLVAIATFVLLSLVP